MKITEEQFQQIIASLGCVEESSTKQNRPIVRVPAGTKATIIPCSETGRREVTSVVVLSLSEMGIGILHGVPMRAGESFILRLASIYHQPAVAILCTVIHGQRTPAGAYAISTEFSRVLNVRSEQISDAREEDAPPTELDDQGLAHLREVELRLSQWST